MNTPIRIMGLAVLLFYLLLTPASIAQAEEAETIEVIETVELVEVGGEDGEAVIEVDEEFMIERVAIEPEALKHLKQMGEFLKAMDEFSLTAQISNDYVLDTGQKIQFDSAVSGHIKKPGRLKAAVKGTMENRELWYDGKTMVVADSKKNVYASQDVPETIDEALRVMADEHDMNAPLSDFALSDPFAALSDNIETGIYLGVHPIQGIDCHHLAFSQANLDWQIWIQDGGQPLPRKVVITYVEVPESPQYTAYFDSWDFKNKLPDEAFVFEAPEGALKIDFLPVRRPESIDLEDIQE